MPLLFRRKEQRLFSYFMPEIHFAPHIFQVGPLRRRELFVAARLRSNIIIIASAAPTEPGTASQFFHNRGVQ
jgi:hypothetical protein